MTDPTSMNTTATDWRKQAAEQGDRLQGLVILNFIRGGMEPVYDQLARATNHRLEFHGLTLHDQNPDHGTNPPPWLLSSSQVAEKIKGRQVLFTNPFSRESWDCIERLQNMLPELDARSLHMPMPITLELEEKKTGRRWLNEHFPQFEISTHDVPGLGRVAKRKWSEGGVHVRFIRSQLDLQKLLRMDEHSQNEYTYEEMIKATKQWSIHCLARDGEIIATSRICIEEPGGAQRFIYQHATMSNRMIRSFNDACQVPPAIDRFIDEFMKKTRWNGFINLEFKCRDNDEDRPVVLEINPRYSDGWDTPGGDFFDITGSDMIETLARYNELAREQ